MASRQANKPHPQSLELPWKISSNLAAWYLVAASDELPEGGVRQAQVGDHEVVLFRAGGVVYALDPFCTHMGARLCNGRVTNGLLACPLHGWQYDGRGRVAGGSGSLRSWPVAERLGGILVFNGSKPLFEPPPQQEHLFWSKAHEAVIEAPWYALTANAFDTHHYQAVHRRRLLQPPTLEQPDKWRFSCSYLSEVTGSEWSDRLMQWLGKGGIGVTMTCYGGPLFTVQSILGKRRASLLVGMEPLGESTRLRLLVGSPARGAAAVLARYLYTSFLASDLKPMTGVRLNPYTGLVVDAVIERFARYLEALPEAL